MNALLAALMPIVLLVPPPQDDSGGDVSAKLLNITKPAGSTATKTDAGLTIEMELSGEPVRWADMYGNIKIKTAKDDHGRSLELLEHWFLNAKTTRAKMSIGSDSEIGPISIFVSINRDASQSNEEPNPNDRVRVELKLEPPPPSATKLAIVEGTLQLHTRPAEVVIDRIEKKVAQPLDIACLNAAGLKMLITGLTEKSLTWEFTGPEDRLLEAELIDAEGKKVSRMLTRISAGGKTTCTIRTANPLPDDVRLKLLVRRVPETIEVPFKFEHVELPKEERNRG